MHRLGSLFRFVYHWFLVLDVFRMQGYAGNLVVYNRLRGMINTASDHHFYHDEPVYRVVVYAVEQVFPHIIIAVK